MLNNLNNRKQKHEQTQITTIINDFERNNQRANKKFALMKRLSIDIVCCARKLKLLLLLRFLRLPIKIIY